MQFLGGDLLCTASHLLDGAQCPARQPIAGSPSDDEHQWQDRQRSQQQIAQPGVQRLFTVSEANEQGMTQGVYPAYDVHAGSIG